MRSKLSDIDFSFEDQAEEKKLRRAIREQDPRRKRISGTDPHKKTERPWKINKQPTEPAWTVERDETGKTKRLVENHPAENIKVYGTSPRTIFELRVIGECFIAGQLAEPGCTIRCFAGSALNMRSAGRVEVIEEIQPVES